MADSHPIEADIVRRMLTRGIVGSKSVPKEFITGWFPPPDSAKVAAALEEAILEPSIPLVTTGTGEVKLRSRQDAERYVTSATDYEAAVEFDEIFDVDGERDGRQDDETGESAVSNIDRLLERNDDAIRNVIEHLEAQNDRLSAEIDSVDRTLHEWQSVAGRRQRKNYYLQLVAVVLAVLSFLLGLLASPILP